MGDDGVELVGKLRRELPNIRLTEPVTLPCSAEFSDEPFKKNLIETIFFRFGRPINRRLANWVLRRGHTHPPTHERSPWLLGGSDHPPTSPRLENLA